MLLLFKYRKYIAIAVLLLSVVGMVSRYHYVANDRERLASELDDVELTLEVTTRQLQADRDFVNNELRQMTAKLHSMEQSYAESEQTVNKLEKLLAKHDLAKLSQRKPGLISNRINSATAKLFQHIEEATGRPE